MNPNEIAQPQLDPQVVNLAKAIRQTESGGDFNAKGKSGEYGAYQFTLPTWQKTATKYGVNVPLDKATKEQQNEVAYKQLKEWKDKGYNPGQIASMWNAGEGEPDAYTGKFSNGKPSSGVNKYGVKYDVSAYAKSVANAYQTLKQGGQVNMDPNNPSSISGAKTDQPGIFQSIVQGAAHPFLQAGLSAARAVQGVGSLIGGNKEDIAKNAQNLTKPQDFGYFGKVNVGGYDDEGKKLSTGDTVKSALGTGVEIGSYLVGGSAGASIAKNAPKAGLLKTLGQGAKTGAFIGAAGTGGAEMAKPESTLGSIAQSTGSGALGGAAFGVAGAGLSRALESIPKTLTQSAFRGLNEEQVAQALQTKTIGTKASLLNQSERAVRNYGDDLGRVLKSQEYSGMNVTARDILTHLSENPEISQKLADTGLYFDDIASKMKKIVPEKANLVDKFFNEGLNLEDLHRLNSALGNNTFKSVFDAPTTRAGKNLGSIMYHGISDSIKAIAPETEPIFSELSKEYAIRAALKKMVKRPSGGLIRWRDIVPFMGGNIIGGPIGGAASALAYRASDNPAVQFAAAKAMQGVAKGAKPFTSRAGLLAPLIQNAKR